MENERGGRDCPHDWLKPQSRSQLCSLLRYHNPDLTYCRTNGELNVQSRYVWNWLFIGKIFNMRYANNAKLVHFYNSIWSSPIWQRRRDLTNWCWENRFRNSGAKTSERSCYMWVNWHDNLIILSKKSSSWMIVDILRWETILSKTISCIRLTQKLHITRPTLTIHHQ